MQFEGMLIKTNSQEVGQAHMYVQSTSCPITRSFRGNRKKFELSRVQSK